MLRIVTFAPALSWRRRAASTAFVRVHDPLDVAGIYGFAVTADPDLRLGVRHLL